MKRVRNITFLVFSGMFLLVALQSTPRAAATFGECDGFSFVYEAPWFDAFCGCASTPCWDYVNTGQFEWDASEHCDYWCNVRENNACGVPMCGVFSFWSLGEWASCECYPLCIDCSCC